MATTLANKMLSTRRSPRVTQMEHIALAFLLAVTIMLFVMQGYRVTGSCMEPHLSTGGRLVANKLAYLFDPPRRGDVIVFDYPRDPSQVYVKRVIGLPGDTVAVRDGQVYVNDKPLPEPYRILTAHGDTSPQHVPAGQYFVMGDNRDVSDDSRSWGDLPRRDIIGRAVACYWPPRQCALLR